MAELREEHTEVNPEQHSERPASACATLCRDCLRRSRLSAALMIARADVCTNVGRGALLLPVV